ncbi:MAG: DUF368 domain-containing protein [Planctomycetes bacterium]|nr:DUF368 domain-containing protein [Planctomycetota bacterium]
MNCGPKSGARESVLPPAGLLLRGFIMGCAELVWGAGGGGAALATGVYRRLIGSLASLPAALLCLLRLRLKEAWKSSDSFFLLFLLLGIIVAFLAMCTGIPRFLEVYREPLLALFLGLMAGGIYTAAKGVSRWNFHLVILCSLGCWESFLLYSKLPVATPESFVWFFIAGLVAGVAAILPGLSGTFLLLMMGKYAQVLGALQAISSGQWSAGLGVLIPLALGCAVGWLIFGFALDFLLKKHQDATLVVLMGFMIGSLHRLWPFRELDTYRVIQGAIVPLRENLICPTRYGGIFWFSVAALLVGWGTAALLRNRGECLQSKGGRNAC